MNIKVLITTILGNDYLLHISFLCHYFWPQENEQNEGLEVE